jgi:hypothetical protein
MAHVDASAAPGENGDHVSDESASWAFILPDDVVARQRRLMNTRFHLLPSASDNHHGSPHGAAELHLEEESKSAVTATVRDPPRWRVVSIHNS